MASDRCPLWQDGRLSLCVQQLFLVRLLPIAGCVLSLALLGAPLLPRFRRWPGKQDQLATEYTQAPLVDNEEEEEQEEEDGEEEADRKEENAFLPPLRQHASWFVVVIEHVSLLVLLFMSLYGVLARDTQKPSSSVVSIVTIVYLQLLNAARTFFPRISRHVRAKIWRHGAVLYGFFWLRDLLLVHAKLVESLSPRELVIPLLRSGLWTILLLHALTAPVQLSDDHSSQQSQSRSPPADLISCVLSQFTFHWAGRLIDHAHDDLQDSDLPDLPPNLSTSRVLSSFKKMDYVSSASLLRRLLWFFRYDLIWQGIWAAGMSLAVFFPPLFLRVILEFLNHPDVMRSSTAWLMMALVAVAGSFAGAAECQCNWIGSQISVQLRSILINLLYRKVLRRKAGVGQGSQEDSEEGHVDEGTITNLMAVDSVKVSMVGAYVHLLWVTVPLQLIVASVILSTILGWSGLGGIALMILLLPLNVLLARRQGKAQEDVLAATDVRLGGTQELLENLRLVKYYAWERFFARRVRSNRARELRALRTRFVWWSISMTVWYSIPLLITLITLCLYTKVAHQELTSTVAFPALSVFALLRIPLDRISDMISFVLQALVSLQRIDRFLREPETDKYKLLSVTAGTTDDRRLGFDSSTLMWPSSDPASYLGPHPENDDEGLSISTFNTFRLRGLSTEFHQTGLNVILGPSGSGKSTLILALLGELQLQQGHLFLPGRRNSAGYSGSHVAYCGQEPWILNQSIRQNITKGTGFDSQRYAQVLHACALIADLKDFPQGDQTLAGDRGARLSGGQKQRVALARALYSRSHHLLLDDCLSAVDSRTAKHIFFNALLGPLGEGRTRIFATHSSFLASPHADFLVCLDDGKVKAQGTLDQLVDEGVLTTEFRKTASDPDFKDSVTDDHHVDDISNDDPEVLETNSEMDILHENKSTGHIGWHLISTYMKSMGPWPYWVIIFALFGVQQAASLGTNVWIKQWSQITDKDPSSSSDAGYYLTGYAIIGAGFVLLTFLRDAVGFWGALQASAGLHQQLVDSILGAKLTFLDQTPIGQLVNRFSKDMEVVDQELATYSISALHIVATVVMMIVLISTVLPLFLLVAVLICILYYWISSAYIAATRDLKRIESVQRSPLYQLFGESLRGYVTIRAFGRVPIFSAWNSALSDNYNRPTLHLEASKAWLTFRITSLSSLVSASAIAFVLWHPGSIEPSTAGLILTYAATFTENIIFLVQLYAEIQQGFNSIERIDEYLNVPQEAKTLPSAGSATPYDLSQWPSQGAIRFEKYTTRYAPHLPPVLHGISFVAHPGERIGVVGRTGAGKSTLAMALIRGVEADRPHGGIFIDEVNIASVPLDLLRHAVTIVPQTSTCFQGSLRENADPLGQHTEDEVRSILSRVNLLPSSSTIEQQEPDLTQPATRLSLGQRQLLCIARALLRRSRVLVFDESTASIDHETEALIQAGIRTAAMQNTSVLTIAHRLHTVADYDRILVMDHGCIVEEGPPLELLQREGPQAVFREMCELTGERDSIERTAREGKSS